MGTFPNMTNANEPLYTLQRGAPSGVASLDATGKVPASELPFELMEFKGNWDASTNTPTLANTDVGAQGNTYRVSVAGTTDFGAGAITFEVGDWCYNTGSVWQKGTQTGSQDLASVLANGISTGANDISVDSGQSILFNNSTFTASIDEPTLAGDINLTLPSTSGTFALTSDIPSAQDLASVLGVGNTTGANDIIVASAQAIQLGSTSTQLRQASGFAILEALTPGRGVRLLTPNASFDSKDSELLWQNSTTVKSFKYDSLTDKVEVVVSGTAGGSFDYSALTGLRNWTMPDADGTIALTSDIPGTPTLSQVLSADNKTGSNDIKISDGQVIIMEDTSFSGNLDTDTLTGARTWNLPNKSGTVALLSDITDSQDLANVLGNGNTTGANDISINTGQGIVFNETNAGTLSSGTLSAVRTWDLPDASGTIALTSDIPAWSSLVLSPTATEDGYAITWDQGSGEYTLTAVGGGGETLAQTLALGNTTGANDIRVNAGQRVSFGGVATDYIWRNGLTLQIANDKGFQVVTGANAQMTHSLAGQLVLTNSLSGKSIFLNPNSDDITFNDGTFNGMLKNSSLTAPHTWDLPDATGTIALTSDIPSAPTTIYSGDGSILTARTITGNFDDLTWLDFNEVTFETDSAFNVKNSSGVDAFVVTGAGNGSLYGELSLVSQGVSNQKIKFFDNNTVFDATLQNAGLTASRVLTLPDATGTIALTSDIPSAQNLSSVLGVGNTTGANNISINTGQGIVFNETNAGTLSSETLSAVRSWELPDASGVIALTGEYDTGFTYTITNQPTPLRGFDASSWTAQQVVDTIATLIADLKTKNIIL